MVAAQHKLSRRALLAGACAVPAVAAGEGALPFLRHPGLDPGSRFDPPGAKESGIPDQVRDDGGWEQALDRFNQADQEIEALVHCGNQRVYDRALGRHSTALKRLLRVPAPDLGAVAGKLDLIVRHQVSELSFGAASMAALRRDVLWLAAQS
jgi:hypothetical protein